MDILMLRTYLKESQFVIRMDHYTSQLMFNVTNAIGNWQDGAYVLKGSTLQLSIGPASKIKKLTRYPAHVRPQWMDL